MAFLALLAAGACGGSGEPIELSPSATACGVVDQLGSLGDLSWYRPAVDGNLDELERWCDSVGPPVFMSTPPAGRLPASSAPSTHALESGDAVVVISWNVHVGQGSVTRLLGSLGPRANARSHLVLLLQEVVRRSDSVPDTPPAGLDLPRAIRPGRGPAEDIVATARALNLSLLYAPSMRNGHDTWSGSREDRGNAILSTLPLTAPRIVELPLRQQRRVTVSADLPIAAGADTDADRTHGAAAIRFISAHVDTRAGGDQARALAGLLRHWADEAPLFIGSDLNALLGRFDARTRSVSAAVKRQDCGGRSYLHLLSLDQVFTDLEGWIRSCRVLGDRFGSDHAPLVAELMVP